MRLTPTPVPCTDVLLNVLPDPQFTHQWIPEPPKSYAEAVRRQRRLMHGHQRRAYLNLSVFLKEACFAVITGQSTVLPEAVARGDHGSGIRWVDIDFVSGSPNNKIGARFRGVPTVREPGHMPIRGLTTNI